MSRYRKTLEDATPEPNTGCLLWLGWVNKNGYGMVRPPGSRQLMWAHRWAWISAFGPIPEGLTVDHRCNVRSCVEVRHLQLVTAVENMKLAAERRRICPRCGGPWSRDGRERRVCVACLKRYTQTPERKARRRALFVLAMSDPARAAKQRAYQRDWQRANYTKRRESERGISS